MQQPVFRVMLVSIFSNRSFYPDGESHKKMARMNTFMLMSVKISSIENIPKSLVIPSSNLKLNESVGQGVCTCVIVLKYTSPLKTKLRRCNT